MRRYLKIISMRHPLFKARSLPYLALKFLLIIEEKDSLLKCIKHLLINANEDRDILE